MTVVKNDGCGIYVRIDDILIKSNNEISSTISKKLEAELLFLEILSAEQYNKIIKHLTTRGLTLALKHNLKFKKNDYYIGYKPNIFTLVLVYTNNTIYSYYVLVNTHIQITTSLDESGIEREYIPNVNSNNADALAVKILMDNRKDQK